MNDKDNKVVNTEEQNRAVNPIGMDSSEDNTPNEPFLNNAAYAPGDDEEPGDDEDESGEIETPDTGREIDTPLIEGDDAGDISRKLPTY